MEEVLILKNNIPIREQLIENYFPSRVSKAQPRLIYETAKECPITHHPHICHLSHVSKLAPRRKLAEQSSKYEPALLHAGECSVEVHSRFSRVEDRFTELSEFFVVED